jgi:hypothetical protein
MYELWLIELHINKEPEGEALNAFMMELFTFFSSEVFSRKVSTDIDLIYNSYNGEVAISKNETELEKNRLRNMLLINYFKMLFLAIINLKQVGQDYTIYESFIVLYFQTLYNYIPNPTITVYIPSFCFSQEQINSLLVEFAKNISSNDFEKLSIEINQHYGSHAAEITTFIANHANLYNIVIFT